MGGAGVHVYFDGETFNMIKDLSKGELSRICQNAVKEHLSYNISLESINKKLSLLEENKHSTDSQIDFLRTKRAKLEIEELEKKAREEKEAKEKKAQEEEEKIKGLSESMNYCIKNARKFYPTISDDVILPIINDYLANKSKATYGFKEFIKERIEREADA